MRHLAAAATAAASDPATGGAAAVAAMSIIACCAVVGVGLALCVRMKRNKRPPSSSSSSYAATLARSQDDATALRRHSARDSTASFDKLPPCGTPWPPAKAVETEPPTHTLQPPEQQSQDVCVSALVHRDEQSATYKGTLRGRDMLVVYVGLDAQQLLRELPRLATAAAVKHANLATTHSVQISPQPTAQGAAICDAATASVRLVHEACSGGDLSAAAHGEAARALTVLEVVDVLCDVGNGLAALHAQAVCHGGVRERCVLLQEMSTDDSQQARRFTAKLLPYAPPNSHETATRSPSLEKGSPRTLLTPSRAGDMRNFGQLTRALLERLHLASQETSDGCSSQIAHGDGDGNSIRSPTASAAWDAARSMDAAEAEVGPSSTVEGASPCTVSDNLGPMPTLLASASDGNGSASAVQPERAEAKTARCEATTPAAALAELHELAAMCAASNAADRPSISEALAVLKSLAARLRNCDGPGTEVPPTEVPAVPKETDDERPAPASAASEDRAAPWTNIFDLGARKESSMPSPGAQGYATVHIDAPQSWGRSEASWCQSDTSLPTSAHTTPRDVRGEPRIPPSTFFNDSPQPCSNSSIPSANSVESGVIVLSMPPCGVPLRGAAGVHAGGAIAEVPSRECSDLESDTDRHLARLAAEAAAEGDVDAPPPLEATLSGMSDVQLSLVASLTGCAGSHKSDDARRRRSAEQRSPVSPAVRLALRDASSDPETPRNLDSPRGRLPVADPGFVWRPSPLQHCAATGLFGWSGKPSTSLPPLPPRGIVRSRTEPLTPATDRTTASEREDESDDATGLQYDVLHGSGRAYVPPAPRPRTWPPPSAPPNDDSDAARRQRRLSAPAGRTLHGVPLRFLQRGHVSGASSSSDSDANTTPVVVVSRGGVVRRVEARSAPIAAEAQCSWQGDPHHAELEGNSDCPSILPSHRTPRTSLDAGSRTGAAIVRRVVPTRLAERSAAHGGPAWPVYSAASDAVSSPLRDADSAPLGSPVHAGEPHPTPRMAQQLQRVANFAAAGAAGRSAMSRSDDESHSFAYQTAAGHSESGSSSAMLTARTGPVMSCDDDSGHGDGVGMR